VSDSPDRRIVETLRSAIRGDDASATARFAAESSGLPVDELAAVLAAVDDDARERYAGLGIAEDVMVDSLADVARKLDAYGATVDRPWLVELLRGDVLTLGRLQFERAAGADGRALHIPEGGALTPAAVDDSLERARDYFGAGGIHCTSWLFHPALLALSEHSNIVAFARRFEVGAVEPSPEGSAAAAKFVFRRPLAEVLDSAAVVATSRVERIVAQHLRSGRHWAEPRAILRS
jgi:hypothetical protein